MVIREQFEVDLQKLQELLTSLGNVTSKALTEAMDAFVNKDIEKALEVLEDDSIPDDLAEEIDDFAILLLTRQQPVAIDLRKIVTSIKVAATLERMADFAVNIAKATIRMGKGEITIPTDTLVEMHERIQEMLQVSLQSYIEEDVALAKKIADMDDVVDSLYKKASIEFTATLPADEATLKQIVQFAYIARHLERLGDYSTNIAENTLYLVKGKHYILND